MKTVAYISWIVAALVITATAPLALISIRAEHPAAPAPTVTVTTTATTTAKPKPRPTVTRTVTANHPMCSERIAQDGRLAPAEEIQRAVNEGGCIWLP